MSGRAANEKSIQKRRDELRNGLSVREVSRDLWERDRDPFTGNGFPVRNRKSWARHPVSEPERIRP